MRPYANKLFKRLVVLSLLLCLLTCGLCFFCQGIIELISLGNRHSIQVHLIASPTGLHFSWTRRLPAPVEASAWRPKIWSRPVLFLGGRYGTTPTTDDFTVSRTATRISHDLDLSYAWPFCLTLLLPSFWLALKLRRRNHPQGGFEVLPPSV
jgi:hypothetical protein